MKELDLLWDETSSSYKPVYLKMIGSYLGDCQTLTFEKGDKIVGIDAFSDGSRLRALNIHLASEKKSWYGYKYDLEALEETGEDENGNKIGVLPFNLANKRDLIGAFGHVELDSDNPAYEHIVSIGLIINDCPGRALLEHERRYMIKMGLLDIIE